MAGAGLLHRRAARRGAEGGRESPGAAQGVGSVAAQHQPRPCTAHPSANSGGRNAARRKGWRPARSPTRAGRGMPAPWDAAAGLPPRQALRQLSAHPRRSHQRGARCQSGQTRPCPRGRSADRGHPWQFDHSGGLQHLGLGQVVGQEDSAVQPRDASHGVGGRMCGRRWPAAPCRDPVHRAFPALLVRGAGAENPWPSAPTSAHTAGCTVIVALSPRCWRAVCSSPIPTTRHRPCRLPTCPRPAGGACLPARVGGFSQPAPATSIT